MESFRTNAFSMINPQPLITITLNSLEQNELTFVPSPQKEELHYLQCQQQDDENERKLSIGSASSLMEEPFLLDVNSGAGIREDLCTHNISSFLFRYLFFAI